MGNEFKDIALKIVHTTHESKDTLKKYEKIWSKTRDLVSLITNNSDDYDGKYINIKSISLSG